MWQGRLHFLRARGEEEPPPCTKNNLVYENICTGCNKGATASNREQEDLIINIPTVYIGETSRTIYERSKKHWDGARRGLDSNHMVMHQKMEHRGRTRSFI